MESEYVPLAMLELEPTLQDKFWEEKVKRSIKETASVKDLQMLATLLVRLATQRQGIIRGLVHELCSTREIKVRPEDLTNPVMGNDSES